MAGKENFVDMSETLPTINQKESFVEVASSSGATSFILGELVCLVLAFMYHRFLSHDGTTSTMRHVVALVLGICIGVMTYGVEFIHVVVLSGICYGAIVLLPVNIISLVLFFTAMGYLLCIHFRRAYGQEGSTYNIDVSGPLMIATQKITSLGFSITDGSLKERDKMSDLRKKYVVMKRPTPLQYFSYIFYFQGLLAGPFSFYGDYIAYVEGTNGIATDENGKKTNNNNMKQKYHSLPYRFVAYKLGVVLIWMGVYTSVKPMYSFETFIEPEFIQAHGILYMTWYHAITMLCERSKYYIAFVLGDAICNTSGFGFNGFDAQGNQKWNLLTNVNILKVEFATSPKEMVDNWNVQTTLWLRHVCFDRGITQQRYPTFVLSAVWHGLFPGYYFSFLLGGIFYSTARLMRRKIRPYFLQPSSLKMFYDILTWILTHITLSYLLAPFILLHLQPTLTFYNALYWWLHITMFTIPFLLPLVPTARVQTEQTKSKSS